MAAAYAAVVCVMNTMEEIRDHPCLSTSFHNNQIGSLGEHLDLLLEYLESYSIYGGASEEVEDLERRIASAAHAAEDVIESHIVDQIQAGFVEESASLMVDLEKIIEEMSLIKEVVAKVKEERPDYLQKLIMNSTPPAPYVRRRSRMATMVGREDSRHQILYWFFRGRQNREILAILAAGGLGKTTLVRNTYENIFVAIHFNCRAWANVSRDYNMSETLLQLLTCLGRSSHKLVNLSEDELGKELHIMLSGSTYLIILDDMWSIEPWDRMKDFFPENNNGSRIIVTTRLYGVASYCSGMNILNLRFLTSEESWDLFRETLFGDDSCPRELEATGRKIAKYCDGHPLLISAIVGLLRKSSSKREFWEYVAERLVSICNSPNSEGQYRNILMFCYDALPTCLKPCFLYMAIFHENYEIRVALLIKLWIAEGFIKSNKGHTLEEIGQNCILELIGRNLISVSSRGSNGKPKTCKIKDFFRDLCVKVAEREKFLSFVKAVHTPEGRNNDRRLVVHEFLVEKFENPQTFHAIESALLARSVICENPALASFKSRLLRVLVEVYSDSLEAIFEQVNLRFLAYESIHAPTHWMPRYELPSSISLLWNAQTLVIGKKIEVVVAPSEIWEMRKLRHLNFYRIYLPDPPASDDEDDNLSLQNLQTLRTVLNLNCSEEVCKIMPNVKKLRVFYSDFLDEGRRKYLYCHFTKLESLHCCFREVPNRDDLLQNLKFPISLKKLVLQDCELQWNDLSIIGLLPFLEVLKLKPQSVRGLRWETVEGEFVRLKILEIDSCYLIYWTVDVSHFPVLEKLVLRRLYRLKEIPPKMGLILTLEEMSVVECSISAAVSAARILEEQELLDLYQLGVRVRFKKEEEVAELRAKMKADDLKSLRLQIDGV